MEVTITDIARICGVSVSTVSRALNHHPDINPETLAKINEAIKKYNYIPNNSARNLKSTGSNSVAVLVKGMANPLFSELVGLIDTRLRRYHYAMILQHVSYAEDEFAVAQEIIKEKKPKGIVFLGNNYSHSEGIVDSLPVPFVLGTVGAISEDPDCTRFAHVAVDDRAESRRITQYLLNNGHRDIAVISAEPHESSVGRLRMEGYLEALSAASVPAKPELIMQVSDEYEHYSMENGYYTLLRLLESGAGFSAVYAMSDTLAIGVYRALYEAGLKIPEDVSVIGFDGIPFGDYLQPKLTTLSQPVLEMADSIVEQLWDMIETKARGRNMLYEGKLLEKGSVKNIS